jgi:hypothetical protein
VLELVVEDRQPREGRVGVVVGNELLEPLDGGRLRELDLDRRVLLGEAAENLGARLARGVGGESHPQRAAIAAGRRRHLRRGAVGALDDLPRVGKQQLARRRQVDLAGRAAEELAAELRLQGPDLRREGRLRDVQPLGRAAEVQLLRDCEEGAQVPKLEVH